MGKKRRRQVQLPVFSSSEIERMEKLVLEKKSALLESCLCQRITEEFNHASGRIGNKALQVHQVKEWFENKLKNQPSEITDLPLASEENAVASDTSLSNNDEKDKEPDFSEMEFEARSARDLAWYDVHMFLAYRYTNSGELEVRVRYEGFGAEEDEWINVKKCLRLRSIPLESECHKINVGDLVLCFWENKEEALYYDAHVIGIEKKQHDARGCRCLFLIRYDHDDQEETVHLRRLCRRPKF